MRRRKIAEALSILGCSACILIAVVGIAVAPTSGPLDIHTSSACHPSPSNVCWELTTAVVPACSCWHYLVRKAGTSVVWQYMLGVYEA